MTNPTVLPLLMWIVIPTITGLLAYRKGYSFLIWFFAAGILGLILLACQPFANQADLSPEE
ncbi:MAG: hypothetical protein ACO34E_13665 [Limisphaerales bacterium]